MRALLAEGIGTAGLLIAIVGSGIAVQQLATDPAIALFAHAVTVGLALAVLIALLGPISGAHFNPAVTLAFWWTKSTSGSTALQYVAVQCGAGLLGVMAGHLMFDRPVVSIATTERVGLGVLVAEVIATTGLVLVILGLVRLRRLHTVPAAVGAWVAAMIVASSSTGFANPAVTIGRVFTDTYTGITPASMPAFVGVQLIGAFVAVMTANLLFGSSADGSPEPDVAG